MTAKTEPKKAVILFSGGLDSSTCLAMARDQGYAPYALTFRYRQRHEIELRSAGLVADELGVSDHMVLDLPLDRIGGSALTADIDIPKDTPLEAMMDRIPETYVPARNTIFLSMALGWAEVLGAEDIFIGVNALDYSGYPDCRPEYIQAFEKMANLAVKAAVEGRMQVRIHTPLLHMTKAEIIRTAHTLGLDLGLTHSCYDPDGRGLACGHCDSCLLRRKGFEEAGVPDPTRYVK
ncbi:MAG: 7-cyano-7-deazaguanine synthase QueC [Desulfovibrionales bacterium]